jgi:hypothetical protein
MLKSVSSITNAIGALNFKGTWDANANSPALASSVGTKGDYYVVGTAGTTNLNGISNWGVGDLATFNGSVWQRVEGGADLNGVNLSVSGTSTLSGLTASTALALNASKEIVSITNTGTGNNVLATTPTLVGDVSLSTGNLVIGTSGKGIDFSATPGTGTSELLADYEEGTWTPAYYSSTGSFASITYDAVTQGRYIKIGNMVHLQLALRTDAVDNTGASGSIRISGLPFTALNSANGGNSSFSIGQANDFNSLNPNGVQLLSNTNFLLLRYRTTADGGTLTLPVSALQNAADANSLTISGTYISA